jgi:CheY-like chemotaxis protein
MCSETGVVAIGKALHSAARILVADDDPQVCKLFTRQLRSAGYGVSQAQSGVEALKLLRGNSFQLLVLDLKMPDIDGFQVLKITRSEFPHLQVLAVSGYMEGVLLEAAECLGARLTMEKNGAPDLLVKTARKLLGDTK